MRKGLVLFGVIAVFVLGAWATEKPDAGDIAPNPPSAPQPYPGVTAGDDTVRQTPSEAEASVSFHHDSLTFEQRVQYQRGIEGVYWSHRIWPAENPGPKPGLDEVLPDAVIRERVEAYLQKSAALELFWSRPLTGEQFQAEMNRMARETRNPDLLRELFAALDDDPFLIAECLARPVLVDRLVRNWYARDTRFHGAIKQQAEAALATHPDHAVWMQDLGGAYHETEWRLVTEDSAPVESDLERPEQGVIELTAEEWSERIGRLAALFGVKHRPDVSDEAVRFDTLPLNRVSSLTEENDRFSVTAVLWSGEDRIRTATVVWNKRPFDAWWAKDGKAVIELAGGREFHRVLPPKGGFGPVSVPNGACTADTWNELEYVPSGRSGQTAVWTGTEMIVWGGWDGSYRTTGGRYDPATDSWTATSTAIGVPSGRQSHTAVWTGTEMIVWGGSTGWPYLNTGGRYDPATDSWTATSTATGVPSGRYIHTAVWTGTEMIVWGGADGLDGPNLTLTNTGGRYDPATDNWTATSTGPGVPSARWIHTAVWTGTEMIVWGGYDGSSRLNTGGRYDPATDSWTATSTAIGVPSGRSSHTALWSGTEMIVWGGYDGSRVNTGGRYDPATDSWTATSTAPGVPSGRSSHTALWSGTEMIVWGGSDGSSNLNTGGRYDPATDSWTATSTAIGVPSGRQSHTAVWTGTEMIVWGGYDGSSRLNTGGRYDPATDSWTATSTVPGVPSGREFHTAVWTGTEMIVWGGWDGSSYETTGGRYDPATDSWTVTSIAPGVPSGRRRHTAVWTGTEMIVWGGYDGSHTNTGGRYDPATDSWTATSTAGVPSGRNVHTAVWTGTEMIVWGGYDESFTSMNTGGRYDPATDSWTATSTAIGVPSGRYVHTAVWTGTEMIVWGGEDASFTSMNTGGRYDPATDSWTATSTAPGVPSQRESHTAVWTGTEMVVWGGYDGSYTNTGGRYDPATDSWTATSTAIGVPSGRYWHTAVWTGTEMIVWGGRHESFTSTNTGGRYDPATDSWTVTSTTAGVPSERDRHTAVWTGTEMIVWGGRDGSPYTNTGGLYCGCEGGSVTSWYPDADGDGYGVSSTGVPACGQPPGHVAVGGDCDDTKATVFPGAPEINDGVDNQCPGDEGYGLVDELAEDSGFLDTDEYSWTASPGTTEYQVARSEAPDFTNDCTVFTTTDSSLVDLDEPPNGAVFYYLARAGAPNVGSWGQDSSGSERAVPCSP